jgi:hypothetical protein
MQCPECCINLPAGTPVCPSCGARLPLICPECGSPLPAGGRFCPACGVRVVEASAGTAPPEPPTAGEERADAVEAAVRSEVISSLPPLAFFGLPTPGVDLVLGEPPTEQEK